MSDSEEVAQPVAAAKKRKGAPKTDKPSKVDTKAVEKEVEESGDGGDEEETPSKINKTGNAAGADQNNETAADENSLMCKDCNQSFPFTDEEKQFFADKGFDNPSRCPACRKANKDKRNGGGDRGGRGARGGGRGGSRGGGRGGGGGGACFICNEEGHMSFACPQKKEGGGGRGGGGGGGSRACYVCNEEGHMSFDCPQKGGSGGRGGSRGGGRGGGGRGGSRGGGRGRGGRGASYAARGE